MPTIETIRQMDRDGYNPTDIAHSLKISRGAVYKYIQKTDFNVTVQDISKIHIGSKIDKYKPLIKERLTKERLWYHKQHYTAVSMQKYLVEELGHKELEHSYHTIRRCMKECRNELRLEGVGRDGGTMPLCWNPGEAQCDFGEADYVGMDGELVPKGKYMVLAFPYSNRVVALYLPGENCECVCAGLQMMFRFLGLVPNVIVFDNATGIGKRVGKELRENEGFSRFKEHYRFVARFANPRAGFEKGCVESAVGAIRRNLFVPPLRMDRPMEQYAQEMMRLTFAYRADEAHYRKKPKTVAQLFEDDKAVMQSVSEVPFDVHRFDDQRTSNTGAFSDGVHQYVLGGDHSEEMIIVERSAWKVKALTLSGKHITEFDRQYGGEPTESCDLAAILSNMVRKPNAWPDSYIRQSIPDGPFKDYMDAADAKERRHMLYLFSETTKKYGFGDASHAILHLSENGHMPSQTDLESFCARLETFPACASENPTSVDLSMYDGLLRKEAR